MEKHEPLTQRLNNIFCKQQFYLKPTSFFMLMRAAVAHGFKASCEKRQGLLANENNRADMTDQDQYHIVGSFTCKKDAIQQFKTELA